MFVQNKNSKNHLNNFSIGFRTTFDLASVLFYISYIIFFGYAVTVSVLFLELTPISAISVIIEMFRFIMKTHAFIRSNVPIVFSLENMDSAVDPDIFVPNFKQFLYFLFAPTLVYKNCYPRTTSIRWKYVAKCFLEVLILIYFMGIVTEWTLKPIFQEFGITKINLSTFIWQILNSMMPAIVILLSVFYLILHSWQNGFAEMLKFGDREFYQV